MLLWNHCCEQRVLSSACHERERVGWRIERHPCCRPRSFRRPRTGHPAEQPPRGAGYGIRCQSALRRQQDAYSPTTPVVAAVNISGSPLSVQRAHPHATYGLAGPAPGDMARVAASAPRPPPLPRARQPTRSRSSCVFTGVLCSHNTRDYCTHTLTELRAR